MKWIGIYFAGYVVLIAGVLAALLKMGILARMGTTWSVIGAIILMGIGIMISVSHGGARGNIEINRK